MQNNFTKNNNAVTKKPVKSAEIAEKVESKSQSNQLLDRESSFAEVHSRKDSLVQSALDKHLSDVIGKRFVVIGAEKEEKPDYDDKTKINIAAVYHVRVTSRKAWLPLGTELSIKIKDQNPIFSAQELQDIMFGASLPVVVTFDELSHYHYGLGESLSAKGIHITDLTPKEAMANE